MNLKYLNPKYQNYWVQENVVCKPMDGSVLAYPVWWKSPWI